MAIRTSPSRCQKPWTHYKAEILQSSESARKPGEWSSSSITTIQSTLCEILRRNSLTCTWRSAGLLLIHENAFIEKPEEHSSESLKSAILKCPTPPIYIHIWSEVGSIFFAVIKPRRFLIIALVWLACWFLGFTIRARFVSDMLNVIYRKTDENAEQSATLILSVFALFLMVTFLT